MGKITRIIIIGMLTVFVSACTTYRLETPAGADTGDYIIGRLSKNIYLYASEEDSVFLSFDLGFNSKMTFTRHYRLTSQRSSTLPIEYVNEYIDDSGTFFYGKLRDEENTYKLYFELKGENIKFANVPGVKDENLMFYPIKNRTVIDNSLAGGWHHTKIVDSTVLAFEDGMIKEYLFNKGGREAVNYRVWGKYDVSWIEKVANNKWLGDVTNERDFIKLVVDPSSEHMLNLPVDTATRTVNLKHRIVNDVLTIDWGRPIGQKKYKRIK